MTAVKAGKKLADVGLNTLLFLILNDSPKNTRLIAVKDKGTIILEVFIALTTLPYEFCSFSWDLELTGINL